MISWDYGDGIPNPNFERPLTAQSKQRCGLTRFAVVIAAANNRRFLQRRIAKNSAGVGARVGRRSPTKRSQMSFCFFKSHGRLHFSGFDNENPRRPSAPAAGRSAFAAARDAAGRRSVRAPPTPLSRKDLKRNRTAK